MIILNSLDIFNYMKKEKVYSKLIRNKLQFKVEIHNLDGNRHLQIRILRDHPSIEKIIKSSEKTDSIVNSYVSEYVIKDSSVRLSFNEESFMINTGTECKIVVTEHNVTRDFSDFKKGKAAISVNFFFNEEIDSSKVRSEIKKFFKIGEEKE